MNESNRVEYGCLIRVGTTVKQMTMDMIDSLYSKRIRNSLGKLLSPRHNIQTT